MLSASLLTACGKDKAQPVQEQQPQEQVEQAKQVKKGEVVEVAAQADNSFPVPILKDGKEKVALEELPEATQAALLWTYDYFNTKGIKTEDEFYDMMKAKYYPNVEVPSEDDMDVTKEQFIFAGYGSEMLPEFTPGQEVESFEVWPEVQVGLNVKVPIYISLKGKDNMHAIAVSYSTSRNRISGADKDFPMMLD